MVHTVATDDLTRVVPSGPLDAHLPLYNFCPPGVMTKLNV